MKKFFWGNYDWIVPICSGLVLAALNRATVDNILPMVGAYCIGLAVSAIIGWMRRRDEIVSLKAEAAEDLAQAMNAAFNGTVYLWEFSNVSEDQRRADADAWHTAVTRYGGRK